MIKRLKFMFLLCLAITSTFTFAQNIQVTGERLDIDKAEQGGPAIAKYCRNCVSFPFGNLPGEINGKRFATSTPEKPGPTQVRGNSGDRVYIATHYLNIPFSSWNNTGKTFSVNDITYYLFERTLSQTGTYYQIPPAQSNVDAPTLVFGDSVKWDNPLPIPGESPIAEAFNIIASPGITILPNGDYLATCLGARNSERQWRSTDGGVSWSAYGEQGWYAKYFSTFIHNGKLYAIGTNSASEGRGIQIKESLDNGLTWHKTVELLDLPGLISGIPSPVINAKGRLWRAFSYNQPDTSPQNAAETFVMSAPVNSDLTDPNSWTATNFLPRTGLGFNGRILKLFEPNAVLTRDGEVVVVPRNNGFSEDNTIIYRVQSPTLLTADTQNDVIEFPGAKQKFHLRYDPISDKYWALSNVYLDEDIPIDGIPSAGIRNRVVLQSSTDLKNWTFEREVIREPDARYHGFQYMFFRFEGNDIIFVSRTAFEDEDGLPKRQHDANYLTFHRIENFRGNNSTSCSIVPHININAQGWNVDGEVTVEVGDTVWFGPQSQEYGATGGNWSWAGPNGTTYSGRSLNLTNFQADMAGTYTVTDTDQGGCTASFDYEITVNGVCSIVPYLNYNNEGWSNSTDVTVMSGDQVRFGPQTEAFGTANGQGWSWSGPNNFTASGRELLLQNLQFIDSGEYTVQNTDQTGCVATSVFTINIEQQLTQGRYYFKNVKTGEYLDSDANGVVGQVVNPLGNDKIWRLITSTEGYYFIDNDPGDRGPLAANPSTAPIKYLSEGYLNNPYVNREWQAIPVGNNTYSFLCKDTGRGYITTVGNDRVENRQDGNDTAAHWELIPADNAKISQVGNDMLLYPNPTAGRFSVSVNGKSMKHISIVTMFGKNVYNQSFKEPKKAIEIDKSFLPGVYLVQITDEKNTILTKKMIVK